MWWKLKGYLKVLFALAIPGALIGLFFYSQQQANKEVAEYQRHAKEHPSADKISIENYELKEVTDANQMRWQLIAKQGVLEPNTKDVLLRDVTVSYFDGDQIKMRLSAPAGIANENTHLVKLGADDKHRVIAQGGEGKGTLDAAKVELKEKNKFLATGGVNIVFPGVAKVSGSTATGSLEKSADLKNFKIVGNTHALLGHSDVN